jgi:CheY-like chemotaxis protein
MDIGLPRMDGWEAGQRIRQGLNGRACLMLAVTGYDRPADHLRSHDAGFQMHLAKPVDPDDLVALLENYQPPAGAHSA